MLIGSGLLEKVEMKTGEGFENNPFQQFRQQRLVAIPSEDGVRSSVLSGVG